MTMAEAEAQTEEARSEEAQAEGTAPPEDRPPRRIAGGWAAWLGIGVAVVLALSGVLAAWAALNDDTIERAETRDAVLVRATQHIETLNTLDYRDLDAGLEAWTDASTGTLRDQLAGVPDEEKQMLAEQQMISSGEVVEAAVTDLDDDTATVIAAVEVTVTDGSDPDAEPTVKRNRFSAELLHEDGDWKLESLSQVSVSLS
ncbi:hypothetical protein JL108_02775 [Aeromicrobium sp. YIM 150415]|uniref:hypothetical protein n=1 Tax=Aeromicrobium sp. YIM 150415 TaxID=2803912 RepID=UPI0019652F67|nr:hypothetical protein [Aeromicrobium sp. YIM 150415]MBM9462356.1 hypothetical protein [Aeromicrobium sp. YIM 150415]